MAAIRATMPAPADRARAYRAAGLWDDRALADGIERAALTRGTAIALADGEATFAFAELARRVGAGTRLLGERGVARGDAVVLVTGNVAAGVVAYHALLRSGATVLLLDRRCGAADLRRALELAGARAAVIAPDSERSRLPGDVPGARAIALESFGAACGDASDALDWREPDRDAAAVVLFTSGTTSRPKAVVHSLNTLTAGARNMARITGASTSTVAFLVSPLASITGVMQMHLTADVHGALVLEDAFDADRALDRIAALGATLLGGAPVIAERLLRAAADRGDPTVALRTLALGGAMLPRPLLERAARDFGIEVARVYGSSESPNTSGSLPGDALEARLRDDGALMPGGEVRVGSKEHAQEGLVRGPALFLGYADGEDSAAAFEDDWYRTGDAVELADGRLTVLGRLTDVVNRNGLKVSLGEIEAALAGFPGASELACFGLPDAETGERLAVAIRAAPNSEPTLDAVVAHLRAAGVAARKLPEQVFLWNEPLPRTSSGKIVRSRLAMDCHAKPSSAAERIARATYT